MYNLQNLIDSNLLESETKKLEEIIERMKEFKVMKDYIIFTKGEWIYYQHFECKNIPNCGKWMYFSGDKKFAKKICEKIITDKVVMHAKYNDEGICIFYLNGKDNEAHKKCIKFMMDNKLIQKTRDGRYYNISFKFDSQTLNGEYGDDFKALIKLEDFIDLYTGEFI